MDFLYVSGIQDENRLLIRMVRCKVADLPPYGKDRTELPYESRIDQSDITQLFYRYSNDSSDHQAKTGSERFLDLQALRNKQNVTE